MVALVVVVLDEGSDRLLERPGQVVVLEQDPVFERLVPALDLALGLRVVRCAADMVDALLVELGGEIARDVGGAVIREQPRTVSENGAIAAGRGQSVLEGRGHVPGAHGGAEAPGDDVATVVVEDRRQVEPSPADDLEVGEVGLPELVRTGRLLVEFIRLP